MSNNKLFACTSLRIRDRQNNIYHGRTMEYSADETSTLTYYPIGTEFQHLSPDYHSKGLKYKSKYNSLCITLPITDNEFAPSEGVNSAGLSGSMNMKQDSNFPEINPGDYEKSVPFVFFLEWALATCSSTDDIINTMQRAAFWNSNIPSINSPTSPFHFIFYDTSDKCIVIEASNNEIHVYDNPTGVMTNWPDLPWHLTNLNNYTQLTNIDANNAILGGINLAQPDTGIATNALPSSDTSVGRFVRAVFYSTFAKVANDSEGAIIELSHIMNKFDKPKNITVSTTVEGDTKKGSADSEFTLWTTLTDISNGKLYVRTYNELNYTLYTLKQFENETKTVLINLGEGIHSSV